MFLLSRPFLSLAGLWWLTAPAVAAPTDMVIYGGTSGGVAAAIQAVRMGKSVVLIEPSQHIGGLTTGGLGATDSGTKAVIGGVSREFYRRLKAHYDKPEAWLFEKQDGSKVYRKDDDAQWTFEPKVAEATFKAMLAEQNVPVVYGERLNRAPGKGVSLAGKRITAITMESGKTYEGKIFIDATYEGDLLAAAGVTYTVGREANSQYGETINGVARKWNVKNHRFIKNVDPYVKPGDPKSGLLFGMDPDPLPADGEADHRLQAYCYRMCMSLIPKNSVPFPKPADYDEKKYELLFRNLEAGDLRIPMNPVMMPNGKTDTNNNYAVSTDYIGQNYKYPEASYAERDKILADHVSYQKGLMWALSNHPRVPQAVRDHMAKWGLAKDEFVDNGNWPHQIYVREARRMIGAYVVTEQDCRRQRQTPESVGMGSYNMDSHNCARYVTPQGFVQNEGDVQESPRGPYRIAYGALVPKKGECPNLFAPVCLSSTHASYGSIRMEPVFMILGQSAATAAVIAINDGVDVQAVPYAKLRTRLLADGQVLEYDAPPAPAGKTGRVGIDPKALAGVVVDDDNATRTGFESSSSSAGPYVGTGYLHDGNNEKGMQTARFVPELPAAGRYEVRLAYSPQQNRATNVPVMVKHADGTAEATVNQRKPGSIDKAWVSLGVFRFEKGKAGWVEVSNRGTDGYTVIDAAQWIPTKD